jgi:hypothetical protein
VRLQLRVRLHKVIMQALQQVSGHCRLIEPGAQDGPPAQVPRGDGATSPRPAC